MVDDNFNKIPPVEKDIFWDVEEFDLPHTSASKGVRYAFYRISNKCRVNNVLQLLIKLYVVINCIVRIPHKETAVITNNDDSPPRKPTLVQQATDKFGAIRQAIRQRSGRQDGQNDKTTSFEKV